MAAPRELATTSLGPRPSIVVAARTPCYAKTSCRTYGGIYREACHDSAQAAAPSPKYNPLDQKLYHLQGHTGSLSKCDVCHATRLAEMFVHGK